MIVDPPIGWNPLDHALFFRGEALSLSLSRFSLARVFLHDNSPHPPAGRRSRKQPAVSVREKMEIALRSRERRPRHIVIARRIQKTSGVNEENGRRTRERARSFTERRAVGNKREHIVLFPLVRLRIKIDERTVAHTNPRETLKLRARNEEGAFSSKLSLSLLSLSVSRCRLLVWTAS